MSFSSLKLLKIDSLNVIAAFRTNHFQIGFAHRPIYINQAIIESEYG